MTTGTAVLILIGFAGYLCYLIIKAIFNFINQVMQTTAEVSSEVAKSFNSNVIEGGIKPFISSITFSKHADLNPKVDINTFLDYEFKEFIPADLKRLEILMHGDAVDALSSICHSDDAYHRGVAMCTKLKELIPRQMFEVAIQASLNGRIIARTTVKALKKNVTAKCYGGDITRKRKLWEKQKKGKKRMKMIGKVEIPQEALLAALQIGED